MITPRLVLAMLVASAPGAAEAHPFHVTIAEVEFNDEAGTLEMAIRIYNPGDLERAISLREGSRIDLERTEEVDAKILAYLRDRLVITRPDGEKAPLEWVGKEVSVKTAWLYVEVPLSEGLEGAIITNTLLFEVEEDQVNTMVFGRGKDRVSLRFSKDKSSQVFRRPSGPAASGGA